MATVILRPNDTVSNAWSIGDHTDVDEEVVDPNGSDDVWWLATWASTDDNDIIIMGFPNTIDDVDEVTNITVKTLGEINLSGDGDPEVDINMGGWQNEGSEPECVLGFMGTPAWETNSFDGSWSQSDLDGLQVKYIADCIPKNSGNWLDVVYVIVTYTQLGAGYTHKVSGIAPANIAKINGIARANIAKVNGV